MDDATQKLVDEAREYASTGPVTTEVARDYITRLADALEAAQRPPVAEPGNHHNADVCPFCTRNRDEREAAIRAEALAQRPPVSPEVRDALVDTLTSPVRVPGSVAASRVFRAETPEDLEDATALADAILARFSLPVLDVEKVAQWLDEATSACGMGFWATADRDRLAAALVASLHTLTTGGTPSDTERNES